MTPLDLQSPVIIKDNEEDTKLNHGAEFVKHHHKYNHCSAEKIREMARQGTIPKHLATCDIPVCSACQYGKASKRPWRYMTKKNRTKPPKPAKPGQVVSVDMMVAGVPGLIAQAAGFLTK